MRPIYVHRCLVVLLIFFTVSPAFARHRESDSSGSQKVDFRKVRNDIREAYHKGELDRVIKELYREKCCETPGPKGRRKEKKEFRKTNNEIRAEIYHWVALSFIALDQPEEGEIFIRKLLVLRRGEKLDDYWLSIRKIAGEKYYVAPHWLVGFKLGLNFTHMHPENRYSVFAFDTSSTAKSYDKDYDIHIRHSRGLQMNFILEYALNKNLALSLQPALSQQKFQYKYKFDWQGEGVVENITADFNHRQRLSYIELPVLIKYRLGKSRLKPYLQIGGFFSLLSRADKTIELKVTQTLAGSKEKTMEENTLKNKNVSKQIRNTNIGLWIGGGISLDTGIGDLRAAIEINYKHGLINVADKNNRYENVELTYGYYDVFDDMKLRSLDFTVKLLLPISFKAFKK